MQLAMFPSLNWKRKFVLSNKVYIRKLIGGSLFRRVKALPGKRGQ